MDTIKTSGGREELHLSQAFLKEWNGIVKPIAEKCAKGFAAMARVENGGTDPEDIKTVESYKDGLACWYVGLMIGDIDRAAIAGVRLTVLNSLNQIYGTLTSESYWKNVWNNDRSSEEANNLDALGKAVKELLTKL